MTSQSPTISLIIPERALTAFLNGSDGFVFRRLTAEDGGTDEAIRFLPFFLGPDDFAQYLLKFELWFVKYVQDAETVLLSRPVDMQAAPVRHRRLLNEGEVIVWVQGAYDRKDRSSQEELLIQRTAEKLQEYGARQCA